MNLEKLKSDISFKYNHGRAGYEIFYKGQFSGYVAGYEKQWAASSSTSDFKTLGNKFTSGSSRYEATLKLLKLQGRIKELDICSKPKSHIEGVAIINICDIYYTNDKEVFVIAKLINPNNRSNKIRKQLLIIDLINKSATRFKGLNVVPSRQKIKISNLNNQINLIKKEIGNIKKIKRTSSIETILKLLKLEQRKSRKMSRYPHRYLIPNPTVYSVKYYDNFLGYLSKFHRHFYKYSKGRHIEYQTWKTKRYDRVIKKYKRRSKLMYTGNSKTEVLLKLLAARNIIERKELSIKPADPLIIRIRDVDIVDDVDPFSGESDKPTITAKLKVYENNNVRETSVIINPKNNKVFTLFKQKELKFSNLAEYLKIAFSE